MSKSEQTKASKFLSLVLRHKPEEIGLSLDESGWANTQELLDKAGKYGFSLTLEQLKSIVNNSDKKRFAFTADFTKIRANQGHSISVDLGLTEQIPPELLYHGTAVRNLESIKLQGLLKRERHHVHLSDNPQTAIQVGSRYGEPVVLSILSAKMHASGVKFFISENKVWLTEYVSPEYIEFPF